MELDLECPVCLETYNLDARQPRILRCSGAHELCKQCVAQLPTQQARGSERRFACPQCRELVRCDSNPNRGLIASLEMHRSAKKRERSLANAAAAAEQERTATQHKLAALEKKMQQDAAVRAALRKRQSTNLPLSWLLGIFICIVAAMAGHQFWGAASNRTATSTRPPAGTTTMSSVSMVEHVLSFGKTDTAERDVAALHDVFSAAHGGDRKLDSEERAWRREHRVELQRLAETPHELQPHAQFLWGKLLNGQRVLDVAKWERTVLAEKTWRAAAEAGHALAMNALGGLLQATKFDVQEATSWWTRALSLAAIPESAYNLGVCYGKGEGGTEVDLPVAAAFYKHAANIVVPTPTHEAKRSAAAAIQRKVYDLWTWGHYSDSFDAYRRYAKDNLRSVEGLIRRAVEPEASEAEIRAVLNAAMPLGDGLGSNVHRLMREQIVNSELRRLDVELGASTQWWSDEAEDDNYCRVIDACLLAVEDAYTVDQDVIGPYAEAVAGMTGGAVGYLEAFLQSASSLELMPTWWTPHHTRRLFHVAEDELGDCYIRHAIEWRDAAHLWGEQTARALRAFGKRVDGAIADRSRWVHVAFTNEQQADLMAQPEFTKLQRLMAKHKNIEEVVKQHPDMEAFVHRLGTGIKPTEGIERRQRRIPSQGVATPASGSRAGSPGTTESAALREQRRLLAANPSFEYVIIDYPTTASDAGIYFANELAAVVFRGNMQRAARGEAKAVKRMFDQLSKKAAEQLGTKVVPVIRKQLRREFGVDPVSDVSEDDAADVEEFGDDGYEQLLREFAEFGYDRSRHR